MNDEMFAWDPADATSICREHNLRVVDAEECPECFHRIAKHGPDGCTAERTVQIEGSSETMHGPCGCEAVTFEPESDLERDRRAPAFPSPLLTRPKPLDCSFDELEAT